MTYSMSYVLKVRPEFSGQELNINRPKLVHDLLIKQGLVCEGGTYTFTAKTPGEINRAVRDIHNTLSLFEVPTTKKRVYEIWSEGYAATGQSSGAIFFGKVEGVSLRDACDRLASVNIAFRSCYDPERLTNWGCRLFDNEADARVSFG